MTVASCLLLLFSKAHSALNLSDLLLESDKRVYDRCNLSLSHTSSLCESQDISYIYSSYLQDHYQCWQSQFSCLQHEPLVIGEKSVLCWRDLPLLLNSSDFKAVVICRDPRAVSFSFKSLTIQPEPSWLCTPYNWLDCMQFSSKFLSKYSNFFFLTYEQLVTSLISH